MWASLLLSLFYGIFIGTSFWFTRRKNFDFIDQRHGPAVSGKMTVVAIVVSILIFGGLTWNIIFGKSLGNLQNLYIGLYVAGLTVTCMLLLPSQKLGERILYSLIVAIGMVTLGWFIHSSVIQSITMAAALLWVGPALTKILRLPLWGHISALLMAMMIDIYTIWFPHHGGVSTPSDQHLNFNGIIHFSHYSLGIGDFFIGAWAISLLANGVSRRVIFVTIVAMSMFRWFWRLGSWSNNIILPYTIVIIPLTLGALVVAKFNRVVRLEKKSH